VTSKALEGKVAVITGAGSGIGRATALLLAKDGARVVVADFSSTGGLESVEAIRAGGGVAVFVEVDVRIEDDVKRMIDTAVATFGRVDVLFNNAGLVRFANVEEITEEEWNLIMDTNVKGVLFGCKHAVPVMKEQGGGVIVNTASIVGMMVGRNETAYCTSKAAVIQLTKQVAFEYAPHNIRVNCVCPGTIDTPLIRPRMLASGDLQKAREEREQRIPLGRLGQAEDIAAAVRFLVGGESSYITGIELPIDGGISLTARR